MLFKPSMSAEIHDWITPLQVEVVKVATHSEQLARIQQRAKELQEAMGPRYLCTKRIACGAWTGSRTGRAPLPVPMCVP